MKKSLFVVPFLMVMLVLSQCRKPVLIDWNEHGGKQIISFTAAGGAEKGDFFEDGNIKYKWDKKDVLFVYGLDNSKNGVGFAGVLITDDDHIYDEYIATFEGDVEVPDGTEFLRFIHYGNEANVTTSGENIGAAYVDLSNQYGSLVDNPNPLSKMVVSYCDMAYEKTKKKYDGGLMLTCFAILRFDFTDYDGYCTDISLTTVPDNAIQVTKEGDISFVSSSSAGIKLNGAAGKAAYNIAVPFDSPEDGKDFTLDLTGGDYSTILKVNLCSNKFYHGSMTKSDAPGVALKRQCANLGLPSGKRWMLWNVGAENGNPEESGGQYQWGYVEKNSGSANWGNYNIYCPTGDGLTFTKYNDNDKLRQLDSEDDAAVAHLPHGWSMPTDADFVELRYNCYWVLYKDTDKNVWGYRVYRAKSGDEGKWIKEDEIADSYYKDGVTHIFLPAVSGITTKEGDYPGYGAYWTKSMSESSPGVYSTRSADDLLFNASTTLEVTTSFRYAAYTIRAVTDAPPTDGVGTATPFGSGNW